MEAFMGEKQYKVVNGTSYDVRTDDEVIRILEDARYNCKRIRIFYGDITTGKCWNEEFDVIGIVGRSMGPIRIPILCRTKRSSGGGAILDNCIVKITIDKYTVYQHENFHIGNIEMKPYSIDGHDTSVYIDNVNVANFESKEKAERWVSFIKGERNAA